ncbi:MAG: S-layer protein [Candidatus Argoarchaeum ethanivorans]|uniref:S-layer protein n=1 Tax=Candidatus Argoarchaeum ethanivorans TaxID=2608793 RepID=A0A812A0I6_9EURY|nr:MAG: S-layer protein [Candidatus Argoarchaeum ethanivorans]
MKPLKNILAGIGILVAITLIAMAAEPPDPTGLANTTGKYWANYTWNAGTGNITDSYNVSMNGTWHNNSADTFMNVSVGPSGWANITVYAYNNSGTGTLSTGKISDSVQAPAAPTYFPPDPTGLVNTTGKYWANYTWNAGTGNITDSYNVSMNGTWHNNSADTFMNVSVGPSGWANITVYAYNNSGTGTLSTGKISDSVQAPAAPTYFPPDPTGLVNTTGKYWANYTWNAGTGNITDSYNVSMNGTWHNNSADTFMNVSVGPSGWANITVYAYNNSGTGTLSTGKISDSVQAPPLPKFYYTGNRIWDAAQEMSTTYTWTPQSFSGFFYDLDNDVSSENLTIYLGAKDDRSIGKGDLVYESKPVNIKYEHKAWGNYTAIGFLAAKYFAGYTDNGVVDTKDMVSKGYLSKVLIDEGEKHTITIGSTLPLKEGYALKAIDISVEDTLVRFVLLKDGEEVSGSDEIVDKGKNYVYEKKVGGVSDVPIIIVHVETVFHGRETDAAFIRGVFQISENPTKIEIGDTYGIMKVEQRSSSGIKMENDDSFDLSRDSIVEIMGDIKFKVADDSDTLRFAPFVEGLEELRGTVSCSEGAFDWTPFNFEGLYYDFDTGFSSETLKVISASGSSIGSVKSSGVEVVLTLFVHVLDCFDNLIADALDCFDNLIASQSRVTVIFTP